MTDYPRLIEEILNTSDVEYKTLGEIATEPMFKGSGIARKDLADSGVPCVRYADIYTTYGVWFDKTSTFANDKACEKARYARKGDILFAITGEKVDDIAKSTAYMGEDPIAVGGDIVVLRHDQDPKYLSYALSTPAAQKQKTFGKVKSKVVHSSIPDISRIVVPVPSIEVQQAIAGILDSFSGLLKNYSDELNLRLVQRQNLQESYIRNLTDDANVKKVKLKDVAYFTKKSIPTSSIVLEQYVGVENLLSGGGIVLNSSLPKISNCVSFKEGDVLIGNIRPYLKKIFLANFNGGTNGDVIVVSPNYDLISSGYLYYLLNTDQFFNYDNQYSKGGKMPRGDKDAIAQYEIPLPALDIQNEIFQSLNSADSYIDCIRKELSYRVIQYEYYRNYLLSFGV